MRDRFLMGLGLARRANAAIIGQDRLLEWMRGSDVHLIVLTEDAGQAAKRKIGGLAARRAIPFITAYDREILGRALGLDQCTVVGIKEEGFAKSLMKKAPTGRINAGTSEDEGIDG